MLPFLRVRNDWLSSWVNPSCRRGKEQRSNGFKDIQHTCGLSGIAVEDARPLPSCLVSAAATLTAIVYRLEYVID